jgi:signal transduction histidine kinase
MVDTWGTLAGSARADGAARGQAERTNVAGSGPPAFPEGDKPAAGSLLAAEAFVAAADPELVRRYRHCATWCGYLVTAIGCAVLIGWLTGVEALNSFGPSWTTMKANTALGLIAAGGALGLHGVHRGEWWWARLMSRLCAVFVMVLAGATLVEYVSGGDLGIDEMLVDAPAGAVGTIHPGRMAPLAMVTFELYGISLLAAGSVRRHWQVFSAALALPATVVSIVVLLGYVFGAPELDAVSGRFSAVAAYTSIALFLLGGGILFANPPAGPLRSLASPNFGGMMLRRMLPVAIVLPTAVEWIRLIAQSAGLFDSAEFGAASVAVAMMISMAGLLIWYAGVLDRLDGARRRGEARIRQLNTALNSRVLALEAANKELQGFSYSMSHVLRAPLRAIHGYAQIVLEDLGEKLGDEGRRLLGVMQSSADEMSELLDGILAFLRLGWQPMTIDPIDMRQEVRTAIALLESKTAGRNIRFDVGELPGALADASMVRQIWLNLLGNAVKFTIFRDEGSRIEIGARSGDGQTIYFVKDNGAGFDMRYVAKLFGVFQRLHAAGNFPGTGIGLAIVNRIVARHGGRVWAEGKPDAGAAFYFSLPVAETIHV